MVFCFFVFFYGRQLCDYVSCPGVREAVKRSLCCHASPLSSPLCVFGASVNTDAALGGAGCKYTERDSFSCLSNCGCSADQQARWLTAWQVCMHVYLCVGLELLPLRLVSRLCVCLWKVTFWGHPSVGLMLLSRCPMAAENRTWSILHRMFTSCSIWAARAASQRRSAAEPRPTWNKVKHLQAWMQYSNPPLYAGFTF